MEKLKDLKDLLTHEIHDLFSAEDQIIEALPLMIEKATNPALKKTLREHLRITEMQRKRLDQVNALMSESGDSDQETSGRVSSFLAKLFGNGVHKCKGMEGVIAEGNKVMALDMNPEVLDAAIIACAQKVEHYEICGYGTARAYARELKLANVAILLEETLNEEYAADDNLTKLAVGGLNEKAENAAEQEGEGEEKSGAKPARGQKSSGAKSFYGGNKSAPKKAAADSTGKTRGPKKSGPPNRRQVAPKETSESRGSTNRSSNTRSEGSRSKTSGENRGGPSKASASRSEGSRNKSSASKRPASTGRSSTGRSQGASKGKPSGGSRGGGARSGGSRGHK